MMKWIAKDLLADDWEENGDVEFTDRGAVDAFAADVAGFVEGRLGVIPAPSEDPAT